MSATVSLVGTDDWLADTRTSYDTVAESYAGQTREALDGKPYFRAALALFAELVRADGMRFEAGSMTKLPLADASVAGLVAWWSLIHVPVIGCGSLRRVRVCGRTTRRVPRAGRVAAAGR